jgi:hypothetical protein
VIQSRPESEDTHINESTPFSTAIVICADYVKKNKQYFVREGTRVLSPEERVAHEREIEQSPTVWHVQRRLPNLSLSVSLAQARLINT